MSSRVADGPGRGQAVSAVALVLLAATSVALTRPGPEEPAGGRPSASGALVSDTQLGCPDPPTLRGADTTVRVGLAAGPGLSSAGAVEAGSKVDLARGRLARVRLEGVRSERVRSERVRATARPPVRATGAAAAGLFAFRTDRTDRTDRTGETDRTGRTDGADRTDGAGSRTLAVASCLAPRARWWFTGAGAGLDHSSILVVANLDPGPAVLDLRVLGPDGEVDTVATTGIVVAPRSQRRIPLVGIAPKTDDLALEVHARRGRVVASVTDTISAQPGADPGRDWVPGTEEASRTLWLAGLPVSGPAGPNGAESPGGPFRRTLLVANPADLAAVVTVAVSGRSGTYTPTGAGEITVAPGGVRTVELGRVVPATQPVAVRLSSSEPVLASVRSTRDGDLAYAGAATALTGPAAAPLVRGTRASVQLTAGRTAERVQVAAYDGKGHRLEGRTITVAPTATAAWSPAETTGYVVVTPTAIPTADPPGDPGDPGDPEGDPEGVRGAVSYAGGGLAAIPLVALPLRESRPHVEPGMR